MQGLAARDSSGGVTSPRPIPLWFLKAVNLGLPVLATAVGGTPEVVRNRRNGRLISASDDEALHEALSGLIATPFDRQRFRDWERQTIERFSLAI